MAAALNALGKRSSWYNYMRMILRTSNNFAAAMAAVSFSAPVKKIFVTNYKRLEDYAGRG